MRDELKKEISQEIRQELRQELSQELRQELRHELASLGLSQQNVNGQPSIYVSSKGSCAPIDIPEEVHIDIIDQCMCELYVEHPNVCLVAIGKVHHLGQTIHHQMIDNDKVRVVVEFVRVASARVPVPTEEVETVGQAPNNFILWPRRLVKPVSGKDIDKTNKDVPSKSPEYQHEPLKCLWLVAMNTGKEPIQLNVDLGIIDLLIDIPFYIYQKDILELCMGTEMLCMSVLQLWLMYLHRTCMLKGNTHLYGFIDPLSIQSTGNRAEDARAHIQSRLNAENNKECFLAPYLHSAMMACQRLEGRPSMSRKKPTRTFPVSQRQTGSYECGYYVMRHMFNIISANIVEHWTERFDNPTPFSEEEIDDIRGRWASFL